jgi:hypothetical protein
MEKKRLKQEQSQWDREQQLREQMEKRYQEQFGLEKQKSEQETARWAPGGMTKPEPFLGPYGPVKMTPQEIPEGPEYKLRRLQSEREQALLGNVRTPEQLAELELATGEKAAGYESARGEARDVLEAQRRAGETEQEWTRRKEELKIEHENRLREIAAGMKPPKEAEEPLIKSDGTVNIKPFFDTANTLFPTFTFYDLTDPKMIENAKKKIYDIVISRFAPTAAEQGLVSTALDQWFNSLFEMAKNTPDADRWKKIDWKGLVRTWSETIGGKQYAPLHPSVLKFGETTPPKSNVQAPPPSGVNLPQREGLLKRGLKKAKSVLGF